MRCRADDINWGLVWKQIDGVQKEEDDSDDEADDADGDPCDDCCCGGCGQRKRWPGEAHC